MTRNHRDEVRDELRADELYDELGQPFQLRKRSEMNLLEADQYFDDMQRAMLFGKKPRRREDFDGA